MAVVMELIRLMSSLGEAVKHSVLFYSFPHFSYKCSLPKMEGWGEILHGNLWSLCVLLCDPLCNLLCAFLDEHYHFEVWCSFCDPAVSRACYPAGGEIQHRAMWGGFRYVWCVKVPGYNGGGKSLELSDIRGFGGKKGEKTNKERVLFLINADL